MTKDFEETLTGFEKLESAMDNWLATDTGEQVERALDELATDTAAAINGLLETDTPTAEELEITLKGAEP